MLAAERAPERIYAEEPKGFRFFETIGRPDLREVLTPHHPWASFSMEIGIPGLSFAGGLGILKGDYFLQAAKLRIPFVGVCPLYPQDWHQRLDENFYQREIFYSLKSPSELGFEKVEIPNPIIIKTNEDNQMVQADVYLKRYGQNPLISPHEAGLGSVYQGHPNEDHRLYQESFFGFAAIRALKQLGITPSVFQFEESATAILGVALLDQLCQDGLSLGAARDYLRTNGFLTNHTEAPEAAAAYTRRQLRNYVLNNMESEKARNWLEGLIDKNYGVLSASTLVMELLDRFNAVSRLHATQASKKFQEAGIKVKFEPITNGIYLERWTYPTLLELYRSHGVIDEFDLPTPEYQERIQRLDPERLRFEKKQACLTLRDFLKTRKDQNGEPIEVPEGDLIGGSARRIVGYKRMELLLKEPQRLAAILEKGKTHLLLAGKVHPTDGIMKEKLKGNLELINTPLLRDRVHFVQDHDEALARHLVWGSDFFINTPRVGNEACGTSGMKAAPNLVILLSTPDGWMAEMPPDAYLMIKGRNEEEEAFSLYSQLEEAQRLVQDEEDWFKFTSGQLIAGLPIISGARMVKEYLNFAY